MKALILKPIMWNPKGYTGPSGYRRDANGTRSRC
jgi:hypothetical protein